jgi:two-component system LytT family sensor kinase
MRVFWVVLGLYILLAIIATIGLAIMPASEGAKLKANLTMNYFIKGCLGFVFNVFFFYFTTNYFFNFITEKRKFFSFLKVSIIAFIACFAYHHIIFFAFPGKGTMEYSTAAIQLFNMTLNTLFAIGASLLVAYLTSLRDGQKQRKVLEAQKMQLEVEKSQANLNFLKAQINPHFLHNTLNFLYAKSLPYSSELSEGILTLSDIMRYALSQGNEKDGKAPLTDEIEHVRNVIKISQLRFSNKLKVNFEVNGVVNGAMIIPFVLITLVENAFKHGDLKNQDAPIDIKLNVEGNKLYFYCRNKKKSGPKELSTGIGLENIRNRLDLAYGNKYSFKVKDEPEFYTTELTIDEL